MIGANLGSIDKEANRAIPSLILHCCLITLPSAPPFKRPQCNEYQIRYHADAGLWSPCFDGWFPHTLHSRDITDLWESPSIFSLLFKTVFWTI